MMMDKTKLLKTAAVAALALPLIAGTSVAQQITLRVHSFLPPPANPVKTFIKPWIEKVEKEAGGKLKIQYYPSMQLGGKPPQLMDQVKDGVVDIIWSLPGYTAGRFPRLEVFELPLVHTNPVATTLAIQDFQKKHLQEEFKDYHVLLLNNHAGSMFMTKEPRGRLAARGAGGDPDRGAAARHSPDAVQGGHQRGHAAVRDCPGDQDAGSG